MEWKSFFYGVITVSVILLAMISFGVAHIGNKISGNAVAGNGQLDTTGWTDNEIMIYEMHGTIPSRLQGKVAASSAASSGMVGGC